MRSSNLLQTALILGVWALVMTASASANIVNVTTSQTLFSDDFESQPWNATSHIAFPDNRVGLAAALPTSPSVGSWEFVRNESDWESIQVTNYADPGAGRGSKYLRIRAVGIDGWPAAAKEVLSAEQTTTGDHIRWEQMVNIGGSSGVAGQIVALGGDGSARINLLTNYPYSVTDYATGYGSVDTGLTYSVGQWQKWQIDYTIGASTFDLKIDNSSALSLPMVSTGGIASFSLTQEGIGAAFCVDQVPEPSTLAMLVAGLFGLLAYAWRKRK